MLIRILMLLRIYRFYGMNRVKSYRIPQVDPKKFQLITVSFNNVETIKMQYQLLDKFIKGEYEYSVFDNSTKQNEREKIKSFCKKNKIRYIALPQNPYTKTNASASHGIALNCIFQYYIKNRKDPIYLGILDHDIFPLDTIDLAALREILEQQGSYGLMQTREDIWYLWPGYSFFKKERYESYDFLPGCGGDTGASNWKTLYQNISRDKYRGALPTQYVNVSENAESTDYQQDWYEMIDQKWLHMINGSGWKANSDIKHKTDKIQEKLNALMQENM